MQFDGDFHTVPGTSGDLLRLNEALNTLAHRDPRKAQVIELRFRGFSVEETAEALGLSRNGAS